MEQHLDFSAVAVTFQALGALLFAIVMVQLARIFIFRWVRLWAVAWGALSCALAAVRIWIYAPLRVFWAVYLVGEWVFVALLCLGCASLVREPRIRLYFGIYVMPLAIAIATLMVWIVPSFNDLFTIEASIVCVAAMGACLLLRRMPAEQRTAGWHTMQIALLTLSALYGTYVPLFAIHTHRRPLPILAYSSLVDLLAGILLASAMILITAEAEQQQLSRAMSALDDVRSELEQRLHIDPLTEVLTRYAFHEMQRGDEVSTGSLTGVAAVFDIVGLKQINDTLGHSSGDVVIRTAATAIRNRIRAEDLLFRFGGDEFVVVVPNIAIETLRERLAPLRLGTTARNERNEEIPFHISWGEAEFGAERSIDEAIKVADAEMYQSRKSKE